jgi:subfamily B ATP-binding cassette protein MsbA
LCWRGQGGTVAPILRAHTFRRLLGFVRPYRLELSLSIFASLVGAGAAAGYAYLVGPLLKSLLTGNGLHGEYLGIAAITAIPLAIVGVALTKALASLLQGGWTVSVGQKVVRDLRVFLHQRLLALPPAFLEARHSGDLVSRFSGDVAQVEFAVSQALGAYLRDGLQVVALLAVCAYIDGRLFFLAFFVLPADAILVSRFSKSVKRLARSLQGTLGGITSIASEQLQNLAAVQAFRAEPLALARFDAEQDRYLGAMRRSLLLRGAYSPTVEWLGTLGVGAALAFGARAVGHDPALAGKLISFLSAALLLYPPLKSISGTLSLTSQGLAAAERLFEIADAPLPQDGTGRAPPLRQALALHDVRVTYPDGREALCGLSLTLKAGQTVALVGSSGAGKSTTAALLLRFLDPSAGSATWDGVPLGDYSRASLREQVAWVSQEPVLFSGTVRDNLLLGRPGAEEPVLWDALRRAHADAFVRALPQGLEEPLGERGGRLSGGQRQRVAIARALLRDPSLLILDEPTSALDAESEREVQAGLAELLKGRTTLVIAHRLATVRGADQIFVLERGVLVESGAHPALVAANGRYAALLRQGAVAA